MDWRFAAEVVEIPAAASTTWRLGITECETRQSHRRGRGASNKGRTAQPNWAPEDIGKGNHKITHMVFPFPPDVKA